MEYQGKLIVIEETNVISEKFKKRLFVIEHQEVGKGDQVYNQTVPFQLTQDNCDKIDGFNVGDEVKVGFNIRGTKWEKNGKTIYFPNLDAWKIDKISDAPAQQEVSTNEEDNLPF